MYERILDLNNLYSAFEKCRRNVGWKASVQKYEANVLHNILELKKKLENGTYIQKPFHEFDISERGKKRHIKSLHITDRVLQRAFCDEILMPAVERYLIYDNGASQKGKGIEFTRKRLQMHLEKWHRKHKNNGYVLQIDFSKFFDNIPHDLTLSLFAGRLDKRSFELLEYLLSTFGGDTGVGIGSQISQVIGIYYPTAIDNFCKTVKGCKFYGRYMDDIYVFGETKEELKSLLEEIKNYCNAYKIRLNERKTHIAQIKNGFTFLNVRYFYGENGKIVKVPARKTFTRERRKLKKLARLTSKEEIKNQYKSWRGNIVKFNSRSSVLRMDALYKSIMEA